MIAARMPQALAGLLVLVTASPVRSALQAPPSSPPAETTVDDAPILEAGEPWTLQIDGTTITAVLRTDPIETGAPILIEFLVPDGGAGVAVLDLP
ncbi:MAG: hypothetical protein GY921_02550, partial [Phycisphaeraceae bacterium]|nr:hypothetical protein [Phycisphaeraceae bacterium]